MSKYVLLTGSTGLLGQYLLHDLLLSGHRVVVLVRPLDGLTGRERIERVMQDWEARQGRRLTRPVCFEGDICLPGLGLEEEQKDWLARHSDRVLHNAAAVGFHAEEVNGEPWRSNLQGTRNTLELCHELNIRQLHYVSTAYVCGFREGVVKEADLDTDQKFRNDYEKSKFQAEQLARSAKFLDSLTVYRPAVVAGDSQTGYTSTYHGLYMYLKLISVLMNNIDPNDEGIREISLRLALTGEERRNIVPLDWIASAICHLFSKRGAHGRTYHLAPDTPITPREIIDYASSYYSGSGVTFAGADKLKYDDLDPFEQMVHDNMTTYESYDTTDPRFDTTNLKRFAPHLPCPRIDEAMLHRFIRYGEEDRWGKRRRPPAEVARWAEDLLPRSSDLPDPSEAAQSAETNGEAPQVIGLDVIGPGGGQWQLTLSGDRILDIEPGLPDRSEPVVRLSCGELEKLIQTGARPKEKLEIFPDQSADGPSMLNPVALLARALRPAGADAPSQAS